MTSLNNPVKLPLDADGNVLANLNAQNITPNAKATNITLDANGNVLANVNAQNINPNVNDVAGSVAGSVASVTGAVGSVTNQVTSWVTISHQTGLSGTPSTANAPVNIGSAIAITKDGKVQIGCSGHVSSGSGTIRIARTRSTIVDYINLAPTNETSSVIESTLFTDGTSSANPYNVFTSTTRVRLTKNLGRLDAGSYPESADTVTFEVLNGDSLQFQVSNATANDITYIDDLVVQQQ